MKKLMNVMMTILLLLIFILSSCVKDEGLQFKDVKNLKIDEIEQNAQIVGETHNDGLSYVYDQLSSIDISNLNDSEILDKAYCFYLEYCHNIFPKFDEVKGLIVSKDYFIKFYNNIKNDNNYFIKTIDSLNFSDVTKNILYSLNDILDNNNLDYESSIELINELIKKSKNEIKDENELCITLSGLYTGLYSLNYWYESYDNWQRLFTFNKAASNGGGWKQVGKADINGAIGGGVAGAIVGGTVTLGIGTVPAWAAGAIGGGLGSSIADGVGQLIDRIF
ncbi:MAG: hypothetical protein WBK21_00425 [Bacteroidales bacterium]